MRALAALAFGLTLATGTADAHEFWIRPDRFEARVGEPLAFALVVGAGFPGERFALQTRRVVRFALVDGDGERELKGRDGDEPAGRIDARRGGAAIAVYRSNDAVADLDAETFHTYLREEGLEHVRSIRAAQGRANDPVRERYSRCAKSLLTIEPMSPVVARDLDVTRPVGLDLEIVPQIDPRRLGAGGDLPVRLTWLGRPAAGLLVKALLESDPTLRVEARSDRRGRATLRLPRAGNWLVNAVRIEAAPSGSGFDWQSTWSSLTFETAAR